ncbi:MAG: exonuclease SbcCD subunit D, partial [Myxococcales bacterium]|nr:exonuclease SbcCD subunit D [Myxococcales bacterium]
MRILHTSDWHVGKRLGRFDRMAEHRAALAEVRAVAERERVDLVIVAGDLFDRPMPPIEALDAVVEALLALAAPQRPVVAIAGNHDSPELFEVLAPLLAPRGVHLVGSIRRPDAGGVLELAAGEGGQRALVACLPFLREGRVVDFLDDVDSWYGQYADKIARLCRAYNDELARRARDRDDAVTVLAAHFIVSGARLGGDGAPRGERQLHIGEAYTATESSMPPDVQYVALGHVHAPQPVPGALVAAQYAGSLLELDFGEAGETKRVVIVEVEPGVPASTRSVALTAGRRLQRARGREQALLPRAHA